MAQRGFAAHVARGSVAKSESAADAVLRRKPSGRAPAIAPSIVHRVLESPGQPLPPNARRRFEAGLGFSLANVRVHHDAQAAESADAVAATAYTVGHHIVFARGKGASVHTLAHELTHVAQQRDAGSPTDATIPIGAPDSPSEHAADHSAERHVGGATPTPQTAAPLQLARQPASHLEPVKEGDEPREYVHVEVPVDHEMGPDEFFREFLRQIYRISSPALQDEIIAALSLPDKTLDFPRVTKADADRKFKRFKMPADIDMWIRVDYLGLDYRLAIGARGERTYSKELANALAHLQKLLGRGGFVTLQESDLARLQRISAKVDQFTPDELELYKKLSIPTDDLADFEASVDAFLAAGGKHPPAASVTPPDQRLIPLLRRLGKLLGWGDDLVVKDRAQLERILALAKQLSPEQLALLKGATPTTDPDALEATLKAVLKGAKPGAKDPKATKVGAGDAGEGLQGELAATWQGVTAKQWSGLDRSGREALARTVAAKQSNVQLKHMFTHPGQLVKGIVTGPFRVDQVGKEVARNIDDVIHGKSGSQRSAGVFGAGKAITGWLAGVLTVVAIIAFILNPAALMQAMMMRILALMIATAALSLVESELRIQQAVSAKSFADFQVGVEQSAAAQAQFLSLVAMMAIPLLGKMLGKIPVVGRVMGAFRTAKMFGLRGILTVRGRIITTLKGIKAWASKAATTETAPVASLATNVRGMTSEQFLKALTDDPILRETAGLDDAGAKQLQQLLQTPEGKQVLANLQTELARTLDDAADMAQSTINEYLSDVQKAIDELEAAKTPEDAMKAVENAEKLLGEEATAEKIQEGGEEYVDERKAEAQAQTEADAAERQEAERQAASVEPPTPGKATKAETPQRVAEPKSAEEPKAGEPNDPEAIAKKSARDKAREETKKKITEIDERKKEVQKRLARLGKEVIELKQKEWRLKRKANKTKGDEEELEEINAKLRIELGGGLEAEQEGTVKQFEDLTEEKVNLNEALKLERPSINKSTERAIVKQAKAEKLRLDDGTSLDLADGEFLDPNTRQPITDKAVIGHKYGLEHRRLALEAQKRGMNQTQFNDWVNRHPEWFQIESKASNESHRFERPGIDNGLEGLPP
jgi:hypothetical protein